MDFSYSEEQQILLDTVHAWTRDAVLPAARELDRAGQWPAELWAQAVELGLTAITAPEAAGGLALGMIDLALVLEALARGSAALALMVGAQNIATRRMSFTSSLAEQVTQIVAGQQLAGLLWPTGSGTSSHQGFGPAAELCPKCKDHRAAKRAGELCSGWLILSSDDGQSWRYETGDNHAITDPPGALGELTWHNRLAKNPPASLHVLDAAPHGLAELILPFAATALGNAAQAVDEMARYALERQQFGQPLARFQDIQWMIADSTTLVEAARHAVARAAWAIDQNEHQTQRLAIEAWLLANQAAQAATAKGVQVHGGYGYTKEYMVERLFRQAQVLGTLPWSAPRIRNCYRP